MPITEERHSIIMSDFSGGMNLNKSLALLEPPYGLGNECHRIVNMLLDERGALKKRQGYTLMPNSTISGCVGIDSIYRWESTSGNLWIIGAKTAANSKVYKFDGTTMTEITGGLPLLAGYTVRFARLDEYLYIYNGNVFQYWNGAGNKADVVFKAGSETPTPKIIEISDGRLFVVSNDTTYLQTVFISVLNGYTTSPGVDMEFITDEDFDADNRHWDGTGCTALWHYGNNDNLLAFTRTNARRLLGNNPSDYQTDQITRIAGAVSQTGICETDYGTVVYVGTDNIYALETSSKMADEMPFPIGDPVWALIDGIDMTTCSAIYMPKEKSVAIFYSGGVLVWNVLTRGWTVWTITNVSCVARQDDGTNRRIVFAFGDSGSIYYYGGTTDNNTEFKWVMELPEFALQEFSMEKLISEIMVRCATKKTAFCRAVIITGSKDSGLSFNEKKRNTTINVSVAPEYPMYGRGYYYGRCVYANALSKIATADYDAFLRGNTFRVTLYETSADPATIYGVDIKLKTLNTN